MKSVRAAGAPTPRVFGCDASRSRVAFAWQTLERIAAPDLNHWFKQRVLDTAHIAFDFARDSGFFLVGRGSSGADLRRFPQQRIRLALNGLRANTGLDG